MKNGNSKRKLKHRLLSSLRKGRLRHQSCPLIKLRVVSPQTTTKVTAWIALEQQQQPVLLTNESSLPKNIKNS